MKYFEEFAPTGESFEDRNSPEPFYHAMGKVTVNFQYLEDNISEAIHKMLNLDEIFGQTITAELSFRSKLDLMSALVYHHIPIGNLNTGADPNEYYSELLKACRKCGALRNQIMHSSWDHKFIFVERPFGKWKTVRKKVKAKSKKGLEIETEEITPAYLLDIADYIYYIAEMVDELFLDLSVEPSNH